MHGFASASCVVAECAKRRHLDEAPILIDGRKNRPARIVAQLVTTDRDRIPAYASIVAPIEQGVPTLIATRDLLDRFHAMIRARAADKLDAWIIVAGDGPPASFVNGFNADHDTVRARLVHS